MSLQADFLKRYARGPAIRATFDLDLKRFGITVLFGPSGCGKTTVLKMLSGLEQPDQGFIRVDGQIWFHGDGRQSIEAPARQVGYVFQESLLFPHLTVAANVAYGLRRWGTRARGQRVAELLEKIGVADLAQRRPGELSGGQKQRVALARALAPGPRLLLLDEPFASLDRPAAERLRQELRSLLQAENIPALLVTHQREDALALGDHLLRMETGRIVQQGRPEEVLSGLPVREGVGAGSLGTEILGTESIVRARCTGRQGGLLRLSVGPAVLYAPDPGGVEAEVHLCIRSEGVALERPGTGSRSHRNILPGKILEVRSEGPLTRVHLDCGFPLDALLTTWACQEMKLQSGDGVHALLKAADLRVIPVKP